MQINAVFEGGELRISLAGAVKAAENAGMEFSRVAGTSSGSIVASVLARGYRADEIKRIIEETPFHSFLQRAPIFNTKFIGPALRVLIKKGSIPEKPWRTGFGKSCLPKGYLRFRTSRQASCISWLRTLRMEGLLVLPDDLRQYGINPATFPVAKAVRMSRKDSVFFDPVILRLLGRAAKGKSFGEQFVYIVDGDCSATFRYGSLIASRRGPAAASAWLPDGREE